MGSFRRGVLIGFALGYTKGAKAGRQRYEQIKAKLDKLTSTPQFKQVSEQATSVLSKGISTGKDALSTAMGKANELQKGLSGSKAGSNSDSGSSAKTSSSAKTESASSTKAEQPGSGAK
ncbi:MAG TPA: hypothetical protein VHJ40_05940 [Actinomycetota bacterium]|nr:hypothetical protein [Actinomycetota bacterium]